MTDATISAFDGITSARNVVVTGVDKNVSTSVRDREIVSDPRWRELIDELLRIRTLEEDWDGDGAARPRSELVDTAIAWIQRMTQIDPRAIPPSYVSAAPGGEIVLVWQTEGFHLEAEVVEPNEVEWMTCEDGTPATHDLTDADGIVVAE